MVMISRRFPVCALLGVVALGAAACNSERKQECDAFLTAMKPLDDGVTSVDAVETEKRAVDAIAFQDEPLDIYAKNYSKRLTVIANVLALQATPDFPVGTSDTLKEQLKSARTDREDVQRYCSQ
jgi:hypothetical protein